MAKDYGAGGGLWINQHRKKDNHPAYKGHVELPEDVLDSLIQQRKDGVKYPKVEIAAWARTAGNGSKYLSISSQVPYELTERGRENANKKSQTGNRSQPSNFSQPESFGNVDDEIPF